MYEKTIVLFDLDNTLFEAQYCRLSAVRKALCETFGWTRFPWQDYFLLRDHSKVFDHCFRQSFHHFWAAPELVILTRALQKGIVGRQELLANLSTLRWQLESAESRYWRIGELEAARKRILQGSSFLRSLRRYVNSERANPKMAEIQNAYEKYENLVLYPRVKELIDAITGVPGVLAYVATEGDYGQQKKKIEKLKLGDEFRGKILASELLKHNVFYLRSMRRITRSLRTGGYWRRAESHRYIVDDERLRLFKLCWGKRHGFFYRAILAAIASNPTAPEIALVNLDVSELLDSRKLSFGRIIMVGDRIDLDVNPIWNLYGKRSLTLRVLKGPYSKIVAPVNPPASNYREFSSTGRALANLLDTIRG